MAEKINRQSMPCQDAIKRAGNFDEVALGYDLKTAQAEASRCLECKNAPCKKGCPVGVDIPEFIACIKKGDLDNAAKTLKRNNSLPAVCGRVCPQSEQCEKLCVRARMEGSVAIGNLERFVGDYSIDTKPIKNNKTIDKKVAVIGSGPAGLSCAAYLASNGVKVTVYEAFHKSGGVLIYGIPEFRLPKSLVEKEISGLVELGVEFKYNTVIGKTITLQQLKQDYDAVFIGSGAGLPMFMGIEGEGLCGVYSANEYLTRVNLMKAGRGGITPLLKGKNVIVVGAGNVAMDSARTARRFGSNVTIVYRRSENEMPARKEEIEHAKEEGINFKVLTNPVKINGDENDWVKSVECIKMELGQPDSSGRAAPVEIKGSNFELECDLFIVALGTSPNPLLKNSCPELNVTSRGTIIVDDNLMTSIDGVYAGGDIVLGAATVILAFGYGKKAAMNILKRFQ